jgi:Predicted hydrolases or acyltransferases (alpha/beta hydrolase superfamily)
MRQIMLDGPAGPMAIWVEGDTGPLVICAHGWPELGYSWRRQSPAIRAAGFRFAAPDMRGYGGSARPPEVSAYRSSELARDVIAIADALGAERFVLIGHDWGAPVAYWTALAYPDRVAAIVGMSVPHTGRPPVSFDRIWEMRYPDSFFTCAISRPKALAKPNWRPISRGPCGKSMGPYRPMRRAPAG